MGSDLLGDIRREIGERLERLRPAVDEYERLRAAAEAASEVATETATAAASSRSRSPRSAPDGALGEAILGVLEHGSHTPAELVVVTGVGAPQINRALRRLDRAGVVAKTQREGKLAWSLVS
jgi:sugar-specific transcriptional regulator TrmB